MNILNDITVDMVQHPKEADAATVKVAQRLYEQYKFTTQQKGVRDRRIVVDFKALERIAESIPLVQSIITKRLQQIRPFLKVAGDTTERGFVVKRRDGKAIPDKDMDRAHEFLMNTGIVKDIDREDDLPDAVELITRDLLVFDQTAVEIRRTKNGEVADWWVLDAQSIRRIDDGTPAYDNGYRYAQLNDRDTVCAIFKPEEMIFDYMNKRSSMRYRGYGFSLLEQAIDLLTTYIFGMSYNRDLFQKDKIPKGFLSVMGDVDSATLNAVKTHWTNAMSGYGGKFAIPILPSGKDGVGVEFKHLGSSNRDMEYHKLLMLIVSLICAVFGIDPAELALKTDESTPLIGDSGEPRIQHSRDTGLSSLLMFVETFLNKIVRIYNPDYFIQFTGIKNDDSAARAALNKQRIESYMTINEVREQEGMEKIEEDWANVVLNPQVVQLRGQAAMQGGGGGAPAGDEDAPAGDDAGDEGAGDDYDFTAQAGEVEPDDAESAEGDEDGAPDYAVPTDEVEREGNMKKSRVVTYDV